MDQSGRRRTGVVLSLLVVLSAFAVAPVAAQPQANLSVDVSSTTVAPGDQITVTYTLENTGDETGNSTSINVTSLPGNWTITSGDSGWQSDGTSWLTIGGLAPGETYEVTATVTVPGNASDGDYALDAEGFVTPTINDAADTTITVSSPSNAPGAYLQADASNSTVSPGENVTFTYTLENTGDEAGNGTSVAVTSLPGNWTVTSDSGDWQASQQTWSNASSLAPDETYEVRATVSIPDGAADGDYELAAVGSVAPSVNDTANTPITVSSGSDSSSGPAADLSVALSSSMVGPGENVTFSYTLTNTGDADGSATGIDVTSLPGNWTVTSDSGDWQADQTSWLSLTPLGPGETYEVTATVTVPENASEGDYAVDAQGSVDTDATDTESTTVTVRSQPVANLSVNASDTSPAPGENVTLTYTLENTGTVDGSATSVAVTSLPGNWTVTSDSGDWQASQQTWSNASSLAPDETYEVRATVSIPDGAADGDYAVDAVGELGPGVTDGANVTLSVQGFSPSNYDTDGDGTVAGDFNGVVAAIEDYNAGELTFNQVISVITAYNT